MPILGIWASQISGHLWAPEGAYDALATATSNGSVTTITFSGIPSGYKHLQIRQIMRTDYAADDIGWSLRFNADTTSSYSTHRIYGNGSSVIADSSANVSYINCGYGTGSTVTSNVMGVSVVDILDYSNVNKYKTTRSLSGNDRNGSGVIDFASGSWRNTAAITSVTILAGAGSFTSASTFALFGVK